VLIELKVLLVKKGLSQKKLAQAIGLSSGQLSRVMNERVRLRASHKRRIAQFLRVPQSQISARKRTRGMSS
jgi:transcriptional regulator with XRE-family HTH domain